MFTKIKYFKYLRCEISYETEKDIQQKLAKFVQILGTVNNTCIPALVQKFSRIKVYKTLALPILLYASEIWILGKKEEKRFSSIDMKFFRTARYTLLYHKRNEQILEGIKMKRFAAKLRRSNSKSLRHITRTNNRMLKIMVHYRPNGR
jgi:hypothetical protein